MSSDDEPPKLEKEVDENDEDESDDDDDDPWLAELADKQFQLPLDTKVPLFDEDHHYNELFIDEYLYRVVSVLEPGESPREAMDRFLGKKKTKTWKSTIKRKKVEPVVSLAIIDKDAFERLAEAIDRLVGKGWPEILTETKETIISTKCSRIFLEFLTPDGSVSDPVGMDKIWDHHLGALRHAKSNQPWRSYKTV